MDSELLSRLDPKVLGERLQQARRARRMTQEHVADHLAMARTTIVAIEKGVRRIRPEELVRLAALYGKPLSEIVRLSEPAPPLAMQLRATLPPSYVLADDLDRATWEFQDLCDDYMELERLCDSPMVQRYPPERAVPRDFMEAAAEDIAMTERIRLGLGDGPLPNLREMLESEVGLRIFYCQLPSDIAAMFSCSEILGGCIAVNANHPEPRRRNSIAHEYGHFLTSRMRSNIAGRERFGRAPIEERFANAFARSFLMPATGIRRRFSEQRSRRGDFVVADLLTLSHYYLVSVEALTRRLEDLELLKSGTWERLRDEGLRVKEARSELGLRDDGVEEDLLPMRYTVLAIHGYLRELLSEGRLARFLRVDRVVARRLVRQLEDAGAASTDRDHAADQSEGAYTRHRIPRRVAVQAVRERDRSDTPE